MGIFKLGWRDLVKGIVVALLAGIFIVPVATLAQYFPFLQNPVIQVALSAIMAYLGKNLATDEDNKLGGII